MELLILNGPNLNLLGEREPAIYGSRSFTEYLAVLSADFPEVTFDYAQSNIEGELIDLLHACRLRVDGVIMNPGGYSHTSVALADAIAAIGIPVIEVHLTNLHAREEFRHQSLTARNCVGVISGFGLESYRMAVDAFLQRNAAEG